MLTFIRLMTSSGFDSALIRLGTRSPYSHAEFLRFDDVWCVPVDTLGSRVGDGVQIRKADYCKPTKETWYTAPRIDEAYVEALKLIGRKYDWRDIVGFATGKDWHTDGQFICSELIAYAFEQIGTPLLNREAEAWRISPRDLQLSPLLKMFRRVI